MSRPRKLDIGRLSVLAVLAIGTVAFASRGQWIWLFSSDSAQTQSVAAPTITNVDAATQWLFRVSPDNGSEVRYVATESLAGSKNVVTGISSVVAGDIVVDTVDPSASTIGTIVVNVEVFETNSKLRDKRIRHDFLESTRFPFARFVPSSVTGLPISFVEGTEVPITISGDLTVKETTAPVTFTGTVSAGSDRLTAFVWADLKMSTFGVGPIHISGLVNTDDALRLEFDLVADRVDLGSEAPAPGSLARDLLVSTPAGGAFAESVQPILERSCVSCHGAGGSGWSTVSIDTAGEAASIAGDIALVTRARYMPPWPASDLSVPFKHDWSLSEADIDSLIGWADAGGGLDVTPDTKLVDRADNVISIDRDLVLPPVESYAGSTDLADDYRCQIIEVPDPEGDGTWVKGFNFEPDRAEVVHHSVLFLAPASQMQAALAKDAADPGGGWRCFGLTGLGGDVHWIAGWAPGQQPTVYPDGVGQRLEPGDFLVNQIHYHYDDSAPADSSAMVIDVMSEDEIAAAGADLRAVEGDFYLTPAEIPCTPDESGPLCDRGAALAEVGRKYGGPAPYIPDAFISQCGGTVADYNQLIGTRAHSSCDLHVRNPGTIYSILGHMHEIGAAYRMTLNPGTPDEKILLDIPTWNFEWQFNYTPVEDIVVGRDDIVRFECTWDRALANFDEPRYVVWNEGTVDEMCFSSIQVIPDKPAG